MTSPKSTAPCEDIATAELKMNGGRQFHDWADAAFAPEATP
jgi:hypothetical protein